MKQIVPFGNRILVQRRKVGEKLGSGLLIAPDQTADNPTEIAEVIFIPEFTMVDRELVNNAEAIIRNLSAASQIGDSHAFEMLLKFKDYLQIKAIQEKDLVFISRYMQTDVFIGETNQTVTLMDVGDIRGLVIEK